MNVHCKGVRVFYTASMHIGELNDPNNHNVIVRNKKLIYMLNKYTAQRMNAGFPV